MSDPIPEARNGVRCRVVAGTRKGKQCTIEDRRISKGGDVTITVRRPDGDRVKKLGRNVEILAH